MKILILSINDSLGGAELYLKTLAKHFMDEDLDIAFIKSNNTNNWNEFKSNANIKFYSKSSKLSGITKFIFSSFLKRKKYDYIFTSHIHTNALVGLLRTFGMLKTDKLICRESTSIFLRFKGVSLFTYKLIYKIGYRNIDLIICQTQLMKDQLLSHFKRLKSGLKVEVIPNPIDLDMISKMAQEQPKFNDFDYLVTAGRLIPVKGYDILIEAFEALKQTHKQLKLVILGEGDQRTELQALSNRLNVSEDVIFEGHVPNVLPYFKNAKACVVSSRIEGFPNVLLQMMSQNENIVSTTCAGGIEDIKGIYTCPPNSVVDLTNTILNCLKSDNHANQTIFGNYLLKRDISHIVEEIKNHLEE